MIDPKDKKRKEELNENSVISKINVNMLMQCEKMINKKQVKELLKYQYTAEKFDSSASEYRKLIELEFSQFDLKGESEEGFEITFTQKE